MSLTFTSVKPRRLVSVQASINSENFVTIPGVEMALWRFETSLVTDYQQQALSSGVNLKLYKPIGIPRGYGRVVRGVLWMKDSEASEQLVALSHLADYTNINAVPTVAADLRLRIKFNTGLDTNNFRFLTKTFQPVAFGVAWTSSDYLSTLQGADSGDRGIFPLPWQLLINVANTHFNTTNVNNAGMYSNFSNT